MTPEVWVRSQRSVAYDDPGVATRAAAILDDGERRRWRRLPDPAAQRDYLAAHLLRRGMLAARSAIDAAAFRFRSCTGGQARIVDPRGAAGFRTSLSHADGIAVCAIAYGLPVGVDVESRRSLPTDLLALAALAESPETLRSIEAMPAAQREERLLRLWTVRGAIRKARDAGSEEVPAEAPPEVVWRYICWWLTPDHLAAVAVRRPGLRQNVTIRVDGDLQALVACA